MPCVMLPRDANSFDLLVLLLDFLSICLWVGIQPRLTILEGIQNLLLLLSRSRVVASRSAMLRRHRVRSSSKLATKATGNELLWSLWPCSTVLGNRTHSLIIIVPTVQEGNDTKHHNYTSTHVNTTIWCFPLEAKNNASLKPHKAAATLIKSPQSADVAYPLVMSK